jgi:ferredoxin
MSADVWSTCALCPRLCRSACPVATGTGREAAVPAMIAAAMLEIERGTLDPSLAREVLTLCTDCGACQDHCHLHRPLPAALREARAELVPRPAVEPLHPIEGTGALIAVESDDRPFAAALQRELGEPVRRWRTSDHLGVDALHHGGADERSARLRSHVGALRVVVVSGGVAEALTAAGVGFSWLHEVVRDLPGGEGSCRLGGDRPLACCGAAGPLRHHHPDDAVRVGALWLQRSEEWVVRDARCRSHLRGCGGSVEDPLDALIRRQGVA